MRIRYWGTRGSIATPGPSTVRYGGNTSCVELRSDRGTLVVFDCGTGARLLGRALVGAATSAEPASGSILLGHTHWDHIQGLPFFEPMFGDGRWHVYGPRGLGTSLDQTLAGQMNYQYFPVALDDLNARVEYHELIEGTFEIDDIVVRTQYLNHPALTLGFRMECDGATICYIADHEPFDPALGDGGDVMASVADARHVEFLAGADLVIHDAQYDAAEYRSRIGWGHSPVEYVVDVACAAGVGRTVLYHHDPSHDDDTVDRLVAQANARAAGRTTVVAAAEGATDSASSVAAAASRRGSLARQASIALPEEDLAVSVVVITDDAPLRAVVEEAATAEGLMVVDPARANEIADGGRLILVADMDDDGGALERVRSSLSSAAWVQMGILAVTRAGATSPHAAPGVTDWLVWPASAAHVRTKLRAAILRRACRWLAAPRPADDASRVRALRALDVLDTDPEDRFDNLTREVCRRFGVPIALITLVDEERQWFKSRQGVPFEQSHRDESFCAYTILGPDVMQVPDAFTDPRFADNPAVSGSFRVRFYAGAPLTMSDGCRIGALCIADHRPRLLDRADVDALKAIAEEVAAAFQAAASS